MKRKMKRGELVLPGILLELKGNASTKCSMMANPAAGVTSVPGARRRGRAPYAIKEPSAGLDLLQETNDSLVGVVHMRLYTPADHQMSLH